MRAPAMERIHMVEREWAGSMALRVPLTIAFVFFLVSLFIVAALTTAGSTLLGAFVLLALLVLAGFAAVVVSRSVRAELVPDVEVEQLKDIGQLRRLAAHYGLSRLGTAHDLRRRIASYHWRERQIEGIAMEDKEHLGRALVERLVRQPTLASPGESNRANRRALRRLVDEAGDLGILARLLRIDVSAYGALAGKAREAAEEGRLRDCVLIVQLANERLRAALEAEITKHPEFLRTSKTIAIR